MAVFNAKYTWTFILGVFVLIVVAVILFGCRETGEMYEDDREGVMATPGEAGARPADSTTRQRAETEVIEITGDGFSAREIAVEPGTRIEFINRSGDTYQLVGAPAGKGGQGRVIEEQLRQDERFTYTFEEEGVYEFYDETGQDVEGTIRVGVPAQ